MIQDTALSQSRPDRISKRLDRAAGPWAVPNKWFLIVLVVVALALPWGIIQLSIGRFILHLLILFFAWGLSNDHLVCCIWSSGYTTSINIRLES